MKDKKYTITINAPKQHVWDVMLGKKTYVQWAKGFSENSNLIGEWKQGTQIDFIDTGRGGTRAVLEVVDKPNRLLAKHIAVLSKDREPQTEGMENWIGTTEEYVLNEENEVTHLMILMHYHPDYETMLDEGWGKSLKLLKELCEND
jgi:hypothetical protein